MRLQSRFALGSHSVRARSGDSVPLNPHSGAMDGSHSKITPNWGFSPILMRISMSIGTILCVWDHIFDGFSSFDAPKKS